jgi:hypothetical protein
LNLVVGSAQNLELDAAAKHQLRDQPENGDWPGDPLHEKPGRDLGHTRYDKMARRWAAKSNMILCPVYTQRSNIHFRTLPRSSL